jgi:hypothetical protein
MTDYLFMDGLPVIFLHSAWMIPLVLVIAYLGSPRFKGTIGESRVRRILSSALQKNLYTVINDLTIASGGGTVRIDHLVISQFGIFVIGTEYRRGTVSGTEVQDRWKANRFGSATRFDNPLHRIRLQIEALERLLHLPRSRFHSIVVFAGHRGFRGNMPGNVMAVEKLVPFIRKRTEKLLAPETASQALIQIDKARLKPGKGTFIDQWLLLRLVLVVTLAVAGWFAIGHELKQIVNSFQEQVERKSAPDKFHADGRRKSERELWEDALICANSAETGRCACYEPGGSKVDLEPGKCQSLAERGSVLKQ